MSRRSVIKHGKLHRDRYRDWIDGIIDQAVRNTIPAFVPEFVALIGKIFNEISGRRAGRSSQLVASAKTGLYIAALSPEQNGSPFLRSVAVQYPNVRIIGPQGRWVKPSTIIIDEGN